MKRFALHPGRVVSRKGDETVWVDADTLADLWKVDREQCFIWKDSYTNHIGLIHLTPQDNWTYIKFWQEVKQCSCPPVAQPIITDKPGEAGDGTGSS